MTNYVFKRPSGYYFRYVIPKPYRHLLSQRELRYPLGTHQQRAAKRRASEVLSAVERLLHAVGTGVVKLTQEQLRDRLKAYARERRSDVDRAWVARKNATEDSDEAEWMVLSDLSESLSAVIHFGDYNRPDFRHFRADLAAFLGVPEEQAVSDPDLAVARREWARATLEVYEYHCGLYSGKSVSGDIQYLAEPRPSSSPDAASQPTSKRISEWIDEYLEQKRKSRADIRNNTEESYRQYINEFIFCVGDLRVREVTAGHAEEFRDKLLQLPKNRNKQQQYIGKTAEQLIALKLPREECRAGRTINEHLGLLRSMFNWLHSRGETDRNPFATVSAPQDSQGYSEYSSGDLEKIFSSELYQPGSSYASRRTTTASHWWFPLFALYTGARPTELIQAELSDVQHIDGVLCLSIADDEAAGKQVKTSAARRIIPLHPELLRLGLEDYLGVLKARGAARVFDGIPVGKRKGGDAVGKWYNERYRSKYLEGFKEQKKVLYSFRHTHITNALNAGVELRALQQWVGHEPKQMGATKHYDKGMRAPELLDSISRVQWDVGVLRGLVAGWRRFQSG